ncbi:MAG: ABC transporter permease [Clostridiales bacterium]|nr:ABC transporter permease [Clostridiales bacterium]
MDNIIKGIIEAIQLIFSGNTEVYEVIMTSLTVSLTSVLIATIISMPIGIFLGLKTFKGKGLFTRVLYTLMGIPPVVMGLVVFLFIARSGPLRNFRIFYTVTAMIIAQTLLILPIIMGNIYNSARTHGEIIKQSCKTLGASRMQTLFLLIKELRGYILIAVATGFGRAISEVGAVYLVGGNILHETRVMTTYITLNTSMGNYSKSIAMAIILLTLSFMVNGLIYRYIGDSDD